MEIVAGIHQIKIPFPKGIHGETNVYIVKGDAGDILIDTGWDSPEGLSAFIKGMEWDRLKLKDIRQIVVTHIHPDHYGLAGKLRELCGAKIAMHQTEAKLIDSRYVDFEELTTRVKAELASYGVPQAELAEFIDASPWMRGFVPPEPPQVVLEEGNTISNGSFRLEVMLTPGHSPGHISLYEPTKRLFFCGDFVLYNTIPYVGLHPQSGDNPLGDYLNSLKNVKELSVSFIFPGHGPVFNSLRLRVEEIIHYREQRNRDVIKALGGELKTVYQVAEEVPWKPEAGGVPFHDLGAWERRLAVRETAAHIRLLTLLDRVAKIDKGGVPSFLAKD
jgi:glyoxylase-like metal-dependent hydrolase (beta-lactamase superfamily II)